MRKLLETSLYLKPVWKYLRKPFAFDCMDKWLATPGIRILDVGCGNHSPSVTKMCYPACEYYGVDRTQEYNLSLLDLTSMDKFYEIDLSSPVNISSAIPDNFFDCIIMSHIIEHLFQGKEILKEFIKKLKTNGIIYLEFPGVRSLTLPTFKRPFCRGCFNFYDDVML